MLARPRLRLRLGPARAGESLDVALLVDSEASLSARRVRFELFTSIRYGLAELRVPLDRAEHVPADGRLGLGRSEISTRFALPAGLSPSLHAETLIVRHFVWARIEQDWAIDPELVQEIVVAPGDEPGLPPAQEVPLRRAGRAIGDLHIRPFPAGLAVELRSLTPLARHVIDLRLLGALELEGSRPRDHFALRPLADDAPLATEHHFVFRLEEWLPGPFRAPLARLRWRLRLDLASWQSGWEAPLELAFRLPTAGALLQTPLDAAWFPLPPLPAEDHQALVDRRFTVGAEVFAGVLAGSRVTLRRERAGHDVVLAIDLFFPDLGLGLRARQATGHELGSFFGFVRPLIIEQIRDDRRVGELAGILTGTTGLACLRLDDQRATLELPDAPLAPLLDQLERFCASLARVGVEIAPPTAVAHQLPAWRALAAELDGTLRSTDLSLAGTFLGLAVSASVIWQASLPSHTRLTVLATRPLRGHYLAEAGQVLDRSGEPAAEPYRSALLALAEGAGSAELDGDLLVVRLRGAADADRVRDSLTKMVGIARVLHDGHAYR